MTILSLLVGIVLPLFFLGLVWMLDLYASGSFQSVLTAFVGGLLAFGMAFVLLNYLAIPRWPFATITLTIAPILEEVLKSLVLLLLVRRPNFTYFVDGAIYGFAAGTAFAVLENPYYEIMVPGAGIGLMLMRAFSTSLMHGTASALVGVALGRMRFARGGARGLSLLLGWAAAIGLHAGFNRVVFMQIGGVILPLMVGLGGVALVAGFIFWGLREERAWLQETLGLKLGVSKGEAAVVLKMEDLDRLLAPIAEHFGEQKREQVESFVRLEAQLGLKRKAMGMALDEGLRRELAAQVADLRQKMDGLRKQVGVYCMSYVRSILPPEGMLMWDRLEEEVARERTSGKNLWGGLGRKMAEETLSSSLFKRLDE